MSFSATTQLGGADGLLGKDRHRRRPGTAWYRRDGAGNFKYGICPDIAYQRPVWAWIGTEIKHHGARFNVLWSDQAGAPGGDAEHVAFAGQSRQVARARM